MNTTSELDANKVDKMRERFIESMRNTPPPQKTAEQMLIDKIMLLEMDLRESSELNEHLRERMNYLKRELIDSRSLCDEGFKTLQEHKDWLKKRITRLEDALRRIAYPKNDEPRSAEATIAFEALNHSKP